MCSVTQWKFDIICHILEKKLSIMDLQRCKYYHLLSVFSSKFFSSNDNIYYITDRMHNILNFVSIIGMGFIQISIIQTILVNFFIRSVIKTVTTMM